MLWLPRDHLSVDFGREICISQLPDTMILLSPLEMVSTDVFLDLFSLVSWHLLPLVGDSYTLEFSKHHGHTEFKHSAFQGARQGESGSVMQTHKGLPRAA